MSNKKSYFKLFAKFACLAQSASDAGKGAAKYIESHNNKNACEKGYSLKDNYIKQAVGYAKKCSNIVIGYDEQWMGEYMGYMTVVYFTIQNYGQISFHCYLARKKNKTIFNGNYGESRKVCQTLNKRFNLQVF